MGMNAAQDGKVATVWEMNNQYGNHAAFWKTHP